MGGCCSSSDGYSMHDEHDEQIPVNNLSDEEKRRLAAEAAEKRLKNQQTRGMTGATGNIRNAHSELPGNPDGNLRWQVR